MNENKPNIGSDLSRVDAHVIQPEEYEEIPELTDAFFEKAVWHEAGKPSGRPKAESRKVLLSVRYSPEVVEYFRSTGKGWQTRMDNALKEWLKEHTVA